jgi:glycosyltransferase involved in cell wall biosynthesis
LVQNLDARRVADAISPLLDDAVIHQHDFLANIALSKKLAKSHCVVWTNHLGEFLLLRHSMIGSWLLRWLTGHYQAILAPSAELADLPWASDLVTRCSNGVDLDRFSRVPRAEAIRIRRRLGWAATERVVLIPRRWAPTKGVIVAARALALMESQARVHAVFVGAGRSLYPSYASDVRAELRNFRGLLTIVDEASQDEIVTYYRASDITLIPSFLEATSLAALEAMASGSLVIASGVGGMPELIRDGWNGFLTPPGDHVSLGRLIEQALALSPAPREALLEHAAEVTAQAYSWTAVARSVSTVYEGARTRFREREGFTG